MKNFPIYKKSNNNTELINNMIYNKAYNNHIHVRIKEKLTVKREFKILLAEIYKEHTETLSTYTTYGDYIGCAIEKSNSIYLLKEY